MRALNIRFTDAELEELRSRSAAEGRPMTVIAHDDIMDNTSRAIHDTQVTAEAANVIILSRDLLKRLADR
jgi:hypothetical protein